jgi:hypothetical protein
VRRIRDAAGQWGEFPQAEDVQRVVDQLRGGG